MRILYLCSDQGIPVLSCKGAAVHVRAMVDAFSVDHDVVLVAPQLTKSPWEATATVRGGLLHIPPNDETKHAAVTIKTFCQSLGRASDSISGEFRRILYNTELQNRVIRRFDSHAPDFIYERLSLFSTAGVAIAQELNCPLIVEVNAPLSDEQIIYRGAGLHDLARSSERWTLTHADAVIVVSETLREHVVQLGVEPGRVAVMPNGVDPTLFHRSDDRSMRAHWGIGDSSVIGFVGGLRPWHGVEIIPQLLEELIKTIADIRCVIIGEGPLRSKLEQEFRQRRLWDRVVMPGVMPHALIPSAIRAFDVAIAPYPCLSHEFYFSPLKIFEYMACGIPVIAPDLGQISDLVRPFETGAIYPAGEVEPMLNACHELLTDKNLRERLGANASRMIHRHHTWKHNADRVIELVRRIESEQRACA